MTEASDAEAGIRSVVEAVTGRDTAAIGAGDDLVERLGADSLQGLQILAGVEKRFAVRLPDDELIHLRTIDRIARAVDRAREGAS